MNVRFIIHYLSINSPFHTSNSSQTDASSDPGTERAMLEHTKFFLIFFMFLIFFITLYLVFYCNCLTETSIREEEEDEDEKEQVQLK